MGADAGLKTKWDEFLDAYLAYIAGPTPELEEEMERLGRELQSLDPKFSYREFRKKVDTQDDE